MFSNRSGLQEQDACSLQKQAFTYVEVNIEATAVTCRATLILVFFFHYLCQLYPPLVKHAKIKRRSIHLLHFSHLCLTVLLYYRIYRGVSPPNVHGAYLAGRLTLR